MPAPALPQAVLLLWILQFPPAEENMLPVLPVILLMPPVLSLLLPVVTMILYAVLLLMLPGLQAMVLK